MRQRWSVTKGATWQEVKYDETQSFIKYETYKRWNVAKNLLWKNVKNGKLDKWCNFIHI